MDKNDLMELKTRTDEETFCYSGFEPTDFDPWRNKIQEPHLEEATEGQGTLTTARPVGTTVEEVVLEMTQEDWQQYVQREALLLAPPPLDDSTRLDKMERQLERIEGLLTARQGQKTRANSSMRAFKKAKQKFVPRAISSKDQAQVEPSV